MSNQVINQEATELQPSSLITLYVLDATTLVSADTKGIFRFHNGTAFKGRDVVWQGETYNNTPCESEGWETKGQGVAARPKIRFENLKGLFTELVLNYQDLVGAKIIRKRTFYSRLDSVNYPDYDATTNPNANPNADPEAQVPDDVYTIIRKSSENKNIVEFELGGPDAEGVMLPKRVIGVTLCKWHYRDGDCGMAEDFCFAQADDTLIPSVLGSALYYRGAYDPAATYKPGSVAWVAGSGIYLKDFYYADTPVVGEDITTSANWRLFQRFTGLYSNAIVYAPGITCYRVLGLSGIREYYYNALSCINIEPPAPGFWITDRCSLLLSGCKIRFSEDPRGLPFGNFPGINSTPLGG